MQFISSVLISALLQVAGWEAFQDIRFKWVFDEKFRMEVEVPVLDKATQALEGKQITLTGYYLPLDLEGNRIIISKMPYASCFFCGGGAGQESVAEIQFNTVQRPFRMDELVTVQGTLHIKT